MLTLARIAGLLVLLAVVTGIFWLIIRGIRNSENPAALGFKWLVTLAIVIPGIIALALNFGYSYGGAFIVPIVCVVIGVVMSIVWTPQIGAMLARPLTSLMDGGDAKADPTPLYSIAIGKRKRGLYREAIYDIQHQLLRFPNDVTGQMLLAEIQAEDLNDLDAAQLTLDRFLAQPGHAPRNIAYALNLLADWQLKYRMDSDAARQSLETIIERLPGTAEAHAATQRIAHLGDASLQAARHDRVPVPLKPGAAKVGLMQDSAQLRPAEQTPEEEARACIRQLEQHPGDNKTRERLALLYADHYQRMGLAADQLEELIAQPNAPAGEIVHWLNLLADLQIRHAGDINAAREALERIVERFPGRAAADRARQRMQHLGLELKGREESRTLRLGSYEQNIGLKSPTGSAERRRSQPD